MKFDLNFNITVEALDFDDAEEKVGNLLNILGEVLNEYDCFLKDDENGEQ